MGGKDAYSKQLVQQKRLPFWRLRDFESAQVNAVFAPQIGVIDSIREGDPLEKFLRTVDDATGSICR